VVAADSGGSAMWEELSEFVGSITTAITRRADKYVDDLDEAELNGTLRAKEQLFLSTFERYAADILDNYLPPGPRRRESLVFAHLYAAEDRSSPEERRRQLVTALLAGEVEFRGPLRLTQAQNVRLATLFEHFGVRFMQDGLPSHAALSFDRAATLFLHVGDHSARERCLFAQAHARHRARPRGWLKAMEFLSGVLCGYGHQPYRLLGWVVFQLAAFSIALTLITKGSVVDTVYMCLINYLNPLGLGDTKGVPHAHAAWALFVVESYAGSVSLSVFFALLVRRWFRS
jgi:hypothetical protein